MTPFTFTNSRGQTYTLHRRTAVQANGQSRVLHYFSKNVGPEAIEQPPDGYRVVEVKSGLPVLKRA